jgi:poly(A) polymerase
LRLPRLEKLVEIDRSNFFAADAVLRLAALLPDDATAANAAANRLRLSNTDRDRLRDLTTANENIVPYLSMREVRKQLYRLGLQRFRDRVRLRWAQDPKDSNAVQWRALLAMADAWQRPVFPLSGRDVMNAGVAEGPLVGRILDDVEQWWIETDFIEDDFSLAERLKAVVQAIAY